ncbi:MAG: hypothetical protein ACRDQA_15145 [Nocardioidaceae bacterium]
MSIRELAEIPEVRRWLDKSGHASLPETERKALLDELEGFCAFADKTPPELVNSCFRTTREGLTKISIKGRRAMQQAIEGYVSQLGLSGREAIVVGNHIRGFLVHNGVFIQGRAAIR